MLIAIHGFKQSGKDTLANVLVSEFGYTKVAFADRLKQALHVIFEVPKKQLWGSDHDKQQLTKVAWSDLSGIERAERDHPNFLSVRELMQIFATEICRSKIPSIWYKYLNLEESERLVISDLRFENEAAFLRVHRALLIKVKRPSALGGEHASEAGLLDEGMDHVLMNDTDLESFLKKGRALFLDLGLKRVEPSS